jgi:hypothetical protein
VFILLFINVLKTRIPKVIETKYLNIDL